MTKRLSYEYVKKCFEDVGWELISKEYKNNHTKLEAVCEEGHVCWLSFASFQQGKRCRKCFFKKNAELQKHDYKYIKDCFEKEDWKLISKEYKNNRTKLEAMCKEGHICWIRFDSFQRGHRCAECAGLKKCDYEYVKEYFETVGWELISKEYKNAHIKLKAKCKEGHICWIAFYSFKQGHRCVECYKKSNKGKGSSNWRGGEQVTWYNTYAHQIDFCEEVRKDPENEDYLQVKCTNCDNWFNPTTPQVVGRIYSIKYSKSENRFYCSDECKRECSIFGQRKYPKGFKKDSSRPNQTEWAEMVKGRDKECIKCGSIEDLEAHHLEGVEENPLMSADIDLGVTLCKNCHKEAHKEKGCRPTDLQKERLCKGAK